MREIKNIKNKKGDIPITFLILGVFLICSFALVSFYISTNRVDRNFVGVGLIEEMNAEIEKYHFYRNVNKFNEAEIMEMLNVKIDSTGEKYIYLEKNSTKDKKDTKLISVRYSLS